MATDLNETYRRIVERRSTGYDSQPVQPQQPQQPAGSGNLLGIPIWLLIGIGLLVVFSGKTK